MVIGAVSSLYLVGTSSWQHWEITDLGLAVRWPDIDEDHGLAGLLGVSETALEEAVSYNRRNWRYVSRILENWAVDGPSGKAGR